MEFEKEFELAKKVIREAGELVLSYYEKSMDVAQKKDASFLTAADIASEKFIKEQFIKTFPEYGFIGEETTGEQKSVSWIVDPIDGTLAFAHHLSEFGIAIAFKKENEIIFGIQYIPTIRQLLSAYVNNGAYCNENLLTVSNTNDIAKSLASIGLQNIWKSNYSDHTKNLLQYGLTNHFHVGLSAIVESYYLASGKVDIFMRFDQPIWDIAAEYILMKEAGAVITNEYGEPFVIDFSNGALHNYIATNTFLSEKYKALLYMMR